MFCEQALSSNLSHSNLCLLYAPVKAGVSSSESGYFFYGPKISVVEARQ
ncbi:MAG: hypothetical protein ACO2PO_10920 [Candidatus Calescibacterium sp.]